MKLKKGQCIVEKQPIVSGIFVNDYEEQGLPALHCALQSAFTRAASILLVTGAICSAISKINDLYVFLILIHMEKIDSHQVMVLQF